MVSSRRDGRVLKTRSAIPAALPVQFQPEFQLIGYHPGDEKVLLHNGMSRVPESLPLIRLLQEQADPLNEGLLVIGINQKAASPGRHLQANATSGAGHDRRPFPERLAYYQAKALPQRLLNRQAGMALKGVDLDIADAGEVSRDK